jgi:hypothetical protein|nr:MAG TPA: hypothetical protein [Caudoviricetes sp.]
MSDDNPSLASLAATLAEVSRQLEAICGSEGESESTRVLDLDPLNELVDSSVRVRFSTDKRRLLADEYLQETGKPRTLRNLLAAHIHTSPDARWYTLASPTSGASYRIFRIFECLVTSPTGDTPDPMLSTPFFALPLGKRGTELIGWSITFIGITYKVLDTYEANGHSYIITESPAPTERN